MTIPDYSTTRKLTSEKPACFDTPVDGMQTLLKTPDSEHKIAEGGLRLQGFFKTSSDDKPLITVVTVVYNGAEFLEETIKSVIEQTYDNVEYIIVDGGSTDGTLDIIQRYEDAIDYWVSEPDKGIYDAMNKGIDLGSGCWLNFMNAGDMFFSAEVLCHIFTGSNYSSCTVLYGSTEVRYGNYCRISKAGECSDLKKGSQFCHQSAIINLKYHKVNKYSLMFKIASDFNFFYKAFLSERDFCMLGVIVSSVTAGGISDEKRIESLLEQWIVVGSSNVACAYFIKRIISEMLKRFVRKAYNGIRSL